MLDQLWIVGAVCLLALARAKLIAKMDVVGFGVVVVVVVVNRYLGFFFFFERLPVVFLASLMSAETGLPTLPTLLAR